MQARHVAIYLCHKLLGISHKRIGEFFSGRKHSSIIHSLKIIEAYLSDKKPSIAAKHAISTINELRKTLKLEKSKN